MTEEQKAWFTYGHAVGCLESFKLFRETLEKIGIRHDAYSDEIICELVGKTESAKKRAVAWNPREGRSCSNCKHWHMSDEPLPEACEYCGYLRSNWTPLEEEGGEA